MNAIDDKIIFSLAKREDSKLVYKMYQSMVGLIDCTWNELYPTDFEIDEDLKTNSLYVLKKNNEIIGSISIIDKNELDECDCWKTKEAKEIARVVIKKEYQGIGYAKILVSNAIEVIKELGYKAVHLSVALINKKAQKLYEHFGFVIVGKEEMYGNTYYLMEKNIK